MVTLRSFHRHNKFRIYVDVLLVNVMEILPRKLAPETYVVEHPTNGDLIARLPRSPEVEQDGIRLDVDPNASQEHCDADQELWRGGVPLRVWVQEVAVDATGGTASSWWACRP